MQYAADWNEYVPWSISASGDFWFSSLNQYIGNGCVFACPLRNKSTKGIVHTFPDGPKVYVGYGWNDEGFGSDNRGGPPYPKPYFNLKDLKNPSTSGIIGDNWKQCEELGGDGKCFYWRYGNASLYVHNNTRGVNIVWCDGRATFLHAVDIINGSSTTSCHGSGITTMFKTIPATTPY